MNMQAQDIREKSSNSSLISKKVRQCDSATVLLVTRYSLLLLMLLVTCYLLLVTVVFAQQPVQQKSLEEERLNIIRADIQKKIEQLEKLKIEIEAAQKALQKAQEEELLKIVKIYEAMPPEEAARKLEALSEDMAVLILISLKPRTAGRVMAQMDTEKAASISKKMLERATEKTSR